MKNDNKKQIFNNSVVFLSLVTIITAKIAAIRKNAYNKGWLKKYKE